MFIFLLTNFADKMKFVFIVSIFSKIIYVVVQWQLLTALGLVFVLSALLCFFQHILLVLLSRRFVLYLYNVSA